jgi:hypothetical protein
MAERNQKEGNEGLFISLAMLGVVLVIAAIIKVLQLVF